MIYGSLCSGIEAASVAWSPLGWKPAFFSEIEKHPSTVLARHHPNVPNLGDMTKFKDWPHHAIDILVGGTPCQSFSVAGLRKGLADPRGNLALTYLAIAERFKPRWIVWENVPGVLSSTSHDAPDPMPPPPPLEMGREGQEVETGDEYNSEEVHAFNSFLAGLSELGYGWAFRILDAQYVRVDGFGRAVPQRRRRVFVVGHLGDWRSAAAVLFDHESLSGHSPPHRETGKGIARGIEIGPSGGGFTDVNPTLDARAKDGPIRNQLAGAVYVPPIVPQAMSSKWSKGSSGPAGDEVANLVAHSLRGEGFDASEDGTGRGWAVRRLTPTECARLQGFPDTYLDCLTADGPKYKALGNSMAVNVMRWLGTRIAMVDALS